MSWEVRCEEGAQKALDLGSKLRGSMVVSQVLTSIKDLRFLGMRSGLSPHSFMWNTPIKHLMCTVLNVGYSQEWRAVLGPLQELTVLRRPIMELRLPNGHW